MNFSRNSQVRIDLKEDAQHQKQLVAINGTVLSPLITILETSQKRTANR
jgi:hypothetical protein